MGSFFGIGFKFHPNFIKFCYVSSDYYDLVNAWEHLSKNTTFVGIFIVWHGILFLEVLDSNLQSHLKFITCLCFWCFAILYTLLQNMSYRLLFWGLEFKSHFKWCMNYTYFCRSISQGVILKVKILSKLIDSTLIFL